MLSASRQYYDRFVERETDDPVLETERGKAYGRLANIEADLGNPDESVRLYIQAVDVFAGLEKRHADNPQYTYLRGAYLANLAGLYRDSGQLELAESTLTDAYKLASGLHEQDSASIEYAALLGQIHNERGVVYMDLGEVDQAEKARLETVNLWQQIVEVDDENEHRHQLATSHNNLAEFYRTNRQPTSATKHFELAQSIWQDLAQANPLISDYAAGLALCEYSLGVMQLDEGNLEQAETLLMSAEGRRRRLAEKHNQLPQYRDDLAASLDSMGRLLHARNDYEAAASDYRMALAIREELRNKFPDVPKYEIAYAASQMNLGYLYKDDRRYAEAANYFRIAIDVLNRVVAENPETVAYHEHLAGANYNLAIVLSLEGELNEAKKYCHAAIQIQQQIGAATSGDGSAEMGLAGCYDLLALIQEDQGEAAAAAVTYEKLITLLQDARTGDVMAIARAHLQLAAMRATLAEFTAAETALTKAIEQLRAVGPTSATDDSIAQMLRIAHSARAEIYDELGKHKLAVEEWDEVVRDDPQPLYQLRRAVSLARSGDHAAAAASLNEVKALEPSDTEPTLLLNAACVLSRAAEAAEADTSLDDQQRDDSVQKLLNEGTAYLQRCLVPEDPRYAALVEYVRSDRDLARLRKYEEVQKLLDETSTDPEAE
jgi:tetratricopeptide (TPR) repeat protein